MRVNHSSNDAARSGTSTSPTATSASPAPVSSPASRPGSSSENGPGHAGRRHRLAELRADRGQDDAEPRVALARPPDGDGGAAAGPQHAPDLAAPRAPDRRANIRPSRHSTTSKEASGCVDAPRGRARTCVDVARARGRRPAPRRSRSSRATTSDRRPRRPARTSSAAARPTPPGPQASSSTRSPGRGADSSSSRAVTRGAARVDVVGVLAPTTPATAAHMPWRWARQALGRACRSSSSASSSRINSLHVTM